ncbi:MAG: valine--tRNA ligase [Gammaproteobacteria bacterium]
MKKTYDPHAIEQRWYSQWEEKDYFKPTGEGEPYSIMLPPPNVTGSLHMGHAFQDTLMDILIRYHRMKGDNTLWQCGTDHAGIATQMVVERQLSEKDQSRHDLGREEFVDKIWEWKEESGGNITRQLRRMGTSMDWSRERFTMDEGLSDAVGKVFVSLYEEGLIYRGKRLVNWDPVLHTAISDLEVVSEEENGHLWHIKYPLVQKIGEDTEQEFMVVATTRPETMLGDAAVAVNPEDERYKHLVGSRIKLPLTNRTIPVIADDYVDQEFGSGCVKITPAHDFNDYDVGKRHDLPVMNVFTDDAALNDECPMAYQGMDRYGARKKIVEDLEAQDLIDKIEDHKHMVPRGDRSQAVVEPYLTDQWYVKVEPLAKPAIEAVENGDINFVPENWSKTYFEWMRNIEDWCISRQLWWGHRIPAWHDQNTGDIYVGITEEEVREKHNLGIDVILKQDPDVLDTWFSSALWPFSTLGWPEQTEELKTFYPTSVLVTGFDIIFFWVARMIMMGLKFTGEVPFKEIYIHGLVRDSDGQKMSKSKGNVLDPIDLIDGIDLERLVTKRTTGLMKPQDAPKIEKSTRKHFPDGISSYGTDALRFTFASQATLGRDIRFDLGRIDGYRNFCNKIWNATRYVMMTIEDHEIDQNAETEFGVAERWINSRFQQTIGEVRQYIEAYRFDLAAKAVYEFSWDEYCDWYLELSKATLNSPRATEEAKNGTRQTLINVLEQLLRLAHPFMPFITEELWQRVSGKEAEEISVMTQAYPEFDQELIDEYVLKEVSWLKEFVLGVRRVRAEMDISPGKKLRVVVDGGDENEKEWLRQNVRYLVAMAKLESVGVLRSGVAPESATALAGNMTMLIPLEDIIDPVAEQERLTKELDKLDKESEIATKKLDNPQFVERAPAEVVQKAQERLDEIQAARVKLGEQLARIEGMSR